MWVEFVVGSQLSSEGFSPGSPVFLPPQKSTFLNSNLIGNLRATGLSVEDCYMLPSLNKVNFLQFTYLAVRLSNKIPEAIVLITVSTYNRDQLMTAAFF